MLFSSPAGNEMFQFPAFACVLRMTGICPAGLPHSETHGSTVTCTSPWTIAAYRVLHRLREPRHPPRALRRSRSLASCSLIIYTLSRVSLQGRLRVILLHFYFVDQMIH